ncbi:hypothetical protein DL765_010433 [Monosporascus sp. GIB2]|nr:hypothetical protein DL765_010433 [Monosporascus sp. GIB2]
MNKAITRLIRLRKQKAFLRSKDVKMVQRELQSLEELEKQKRREQADTEASMAAFVPPVGPVDWSGIENTDLSAEDVDWSSILGGPVAAGENSSAGVVHRPDS